MEEEEEEAEAEAVRGDGMGEGGGVERGGWTDIKRAEWGKGRLERIWEKGEI